MIDSLKKIDALPTRHGHIGQARVVRDLVRLADADSESFRSLIQSVDVWGGSGAVWEVGSLGSDTRAFWQAIVNLADQMDRNDLGTDRSRSIASTLRERLEPDVDES